MPHVKSPPMSSRAVDHFAVLGIGRDAKTEEIRQQFQLLAKQLHPDVNSSPDAAARFVVVKEAYEALRDESRRRQYHSSRSVRAGVYYDPDTAESIRQRASKFKKAQNSSCTVTARVCK